MRLDFQGIEVGGAAAPVQAAEPDRSRIVEYRPHDTVVMEGDPADNVFEIVEGALMLYKLLPDGRRQVVELLAAGDFFGCGIGDDHDCSAETLAPTRLSIIARPLVESDPDLQARMMRRGWARLTALREHAMLLGRKSAMERVASFIERLTEGSGQELIQLRMTRQEIADYLGLTIETVSRSFSELRRRGIVICERQDMIRVPDPDRIAVLTGA